ncbi:hypothetical protein Cri9333_3622 [Crinalium epipsammum PCC 9333]|uniref:Peptidase domain protein n=1 Tax=Crinalium epipsammum PCC 9333 TaxID=1173022 RepID=K9W2I9_9CYAN|nr:hypothetical protein [Crinalium epipsammum]AFZ14441.1 hypothetical protein Cri9333_3622 [Crinalium epipsammum PCC 9333]
MRFFKNLGILTLTTALFATPSIAENANFGELTLTPGFKKTSIRGYTDGSYSLPSIANRDRNNNACIGFASPAPDHVIILQKDFARLQIKVNSRGKDTTLVIKGPGGTIRCGDDTGKTKDASISDTKWKAGEYQVWVGSIESKQTWNYTLFIQE